MNWRNFFKLKYITRLWLIPVLVLIAIIGVIIAVKSYYKDNDGIRSSFYNPLSDLSTEELVEYGDRCQNPDSALMYYTIGIKNFETNPKQEHRLDYVRALNHAGYCSLFMLGDFKEAYQYLTRALKEAQELDNSTQVAVICLNLANLYIGGDDIESAYKQYVSSMRHAAMAKDSEIFYSALVGYLFHTTLNGDNISINSITRDYNMMRNSPKSELKNFAGHILNGVAAMEANDHTRALEEFDESLKFIDTSYTPERYPAIPIFLKSEVYRRQGDYQQATETIEHSFDQLTAESRASAYRRVGELYRESGNKTAADWNRLRYYDISDSSRYLWRHADLIQAHNAIERNELTRNLDQMISRAHTAHTVIIILLIVGSVIGVIGIVLWRTNRKLIRSKQHLYEKNKELQTYILSGTDTCKEKNPKATKAVSDEEEPIDISDPKISEVWKHVKDVMLKSDEKFSPEFSVARLSLLAGEHPRKVSEAINRNLGKSFNAWLSELRVSEACLRLDDFERYGNLTISAIAEGVGFRSRTHFADVFKKITGLTPSEYLKISKQNSSR